MALLEIKNLHVGIDGKEILKGLDLTVNAGEVHAIMGPNGSGKSTLAYVLAGKAGYEPTAGEVLFNGKNIFDMTPDERASLLKEADELVDKAKEIKQKKMETPAKT